MSFLDKTGALWLMQKVKTAIAEVNTIVNKIDESVTNVTEKVNKIDSTVDGIVSTGGEANVINGIIVNNAEVTPDENKKITLSIPTAEEINNAAKQAAVDAIADVEKIEPAVVAELPETGTEGTMYFVPVENGADGDLYEEYVYINGAYEKINGQKIDLEGYAKVTDLENYTKVTDVIEINELLAMWNSSGAEPEVTPEPENPEDPTENSEG